MNNLVIYDFEQLYEILNEIKGNLKFNLINCNKTNISQLELLKKDDYLVLSRKKIKNFNNQIIINDLPTKIFKLIEKLNINFHKHKFKQQLDIEIGDLKLNLNSRKIFNREIELELTEKETKIILFLKNSENPVSISQLQKDVWGYNNKLETHTVETHIYRLRKKINSKFKINTLINSSKLGYYIN